MWGNRQFSGITAVQNRAERFYLGVGKPLLMVISEGYGLLLNKEKLWLIIGTESSLWTMDVLIRRFIIGLSEFRIIIVEIGVLGSVKCLKKVKLNIYFQG